MTGGWWPRSDDLASELPDLLRGLSVRLGDISRVTYNRTEWAAAPKKLRFDDQLVRLDGYDRQPANTVGVLGVGGEEILLVVVPVLASPDDAHAVMMAAAVSENASKVRALLASRQVPRSG